MKFVFRTDASFQIGTGHVTRCLTLADSLRENGGQCLFVCREHPGSLLESIRDRGHGVHGLPLDTKFSSNSDLVDELSPIHAPWLGTDWRNDAAQTLEVLGNTAFDWLIVDHYALESRWERALRGVARQLMVIDDLADRQHDCDMLLDQNLGRQVTDYSQLVPDACKIMVGPEYALLRPEFAASRDFSLNRRAEPKIKQVLVTMGGVDQADVTGRVLESLKSCPLPKGCKVIVVMGHHAPWLEQVKSLAADMPCCTEVRVNVPDMAQLMADSDIAIGAAGSTSWERCCLGLPSIVLVLADNQDQVARYLDSSGAAVRIDSGSELVGQLSSKISEIICDHDLLNSLSFSASELVDGNGVRRVCDAMELLATGA